MAAVTTKKTGLGERIRVLNDKFPLVVIGILIGLISMTIAIYFAVFYSRTPLLSVEKLTETDVVQVSEEINDLEIFYDSTNIKESNKNLKIVTFQLINKGNKDIEESSYAEAIPFRLAIKDGLVVERPAITKTSNSYLAKFNVLETDSLKERINLPRVVMEQGEFYTIKILILHNKNQSPSFEIEGKIVGQSEIKVLEEISSNGKGFFSENLIGKISIIIVTIILLFILIAFILTRRDNYRAKMAKKFRKELVKDFLVARGISLTPRLEAVFSSYYKIYYYRKNCEWQTDELDTILNFLRDKHARKISEIARKQFSEGGLFNAQVAISRMARIYDTSQDIGLSFISETEALEDFSIINSFCQYVKDKRSRNLKSKKPKDNMHTDTPNDDPIF